MSNWLPVFSALILLSNLLTPALVYSQEVSTPSASLSEEVSFPTPEAFPTETPSSLSEWIKNEDGSFTTTNKVAVNQIYQAPFNNKLTLQFTKLPAESGTITVREVAMSFNVEGKQLSSAFDITSSMENNTFEYILTLPTPTTENVEVKASEDGTRFVTLGGVTAQDGILKITGLTHFTFFLVTTVADFEAGVSTDTTINDVGDGEGDVENTLGGEVIGESQSTGTTTQIFDNTNWVAQTFTASTTSLLTKVTLSLRRAANTNGNVTVEIRNTLSGAPGSTILASVSRPATNLTTSQADYDFTPTEPIPLEFGTEYAIVIYRSGNGNITANYTWFRAISGSGNNQYLPGGRFRSTNSGLTWTLQTPANPGTGDLRFKTYIRSYPNSGTQTSDVLNTLSTNTKFVLLEWTETLPDATDITFEVRASNTAFSKDDVSLAWISLGIADSPVTLTAALPETYQYFQWRSTLTGSGNATPTLHDVTSTYLFPPEAAPGGGEYFSDTIVTLTAEEGTTIRYTTDDTTPTDSVGILYTDPILITTDTILKAVAIDAGGGLSSVLEELYSVAPVISGESASSVTSSTATITWTTDDPSTSRVIYDTVSHPVLGAVPNYGYANATVEDPTKVTSHSVLLSGLLAGTTYYYRTISKGSPEAVGSENTVTTTSPLSPSSSADGGGGGGGGGTAPVCSDSPPGGSPVLLSATPSGPNQVTLAWSQVQDPLTHYVVSYGLAAGIPLYGNPSVGGKSTTSYTVSNLSGGTTYYFRVRAGNGCNGGAYSNELSATPGGGIAIGPAAGFLPGVLGVKTENEGNVGIGESQVKGETTSSNQPSATSQSQEGAGQSQFNVKTIAIIAIVLLIGFGAVRLFLK